MTTFTLPKSVFRYIAVIILSVLSYTAIAQNFIEVDKLIASDRSAEDIFGMYAVAVDGNYAFVGAPYECEDVAGNNYMWDAGSVYIYERDANGNWVEIQKIVASNRSVYHQFGTSVSVSGNYAVIGAVHGNRDPSSSPAQHYTGTAYVWKLMSNGLWVEQQEISPSDGMVYDDFGTSVSISGTDITVGSPKYSHISPDGTPLIHAGAIYFFKEDPSGNWVEEQKLLASNPALGAYYGTSVSISGDYVVVGAPNSPGTKWGSAYLLERNTNGLWLEKQQVFASDRRGNDYFGFSVSISGCYVIVGAFGQSQISGFAYVFERNVQGNWLEKQKVMASESPYIDYFGISVSISGNKAMVGSYGANFNALGLDSLSNAGAAYVFVRNWQGNWLQKQKLVASDRKQFNSFGRSVAIAKDYVVVGSWNEQDLHGNNTLFKAGAAYVFEHPPCLNSAFSSSVIECESYTVPSSNATYANVGNYTVNDTVPNHCGGDSILTINVTILPPKTSNVNTTICNNDSVIVNGTVYNAVHPSGTEIIPNIGPYNCDSTITVNLNVLDLKTESLTDILCEGDSVVVNGTTYNANHLSGTETYTGVGQFKCDSMVIIDLKLYTPLKIELLTMEEVCVNEEVQVFADIEGGKPPYSYFWKFNETVDSLSIFKFTPTLITEGIVLIHITDGCQESDSTETAIYIKDCELVIPNVFTPNGDGVHEYFYIKGLQYYMSNNLQVYNRWGVLLFEQANYRNTWDGYQCPAGVYFYILETTKNGISNTHKGSITLLK